MFLAAWGVSGCDSKADAPSQKGSGDAPAVSAAAISPAARSGIQPAFVCPGTTRIESLICSDERLSALDHGLSVVYRSARKGREGEKIAADQKAWLSGLRAACADAACLAQAYQERLTELHGDYQPGARYETRPNDLALTQLPDGWYVFTLFGTYTSGEMTNDGGGGGVFKLVGGKGQSPAPAADQCGYSFVRLPGDQWRVEQHEPGDDTVCQGLNVSLSGDYRRVK